MNPEPNESSEFEIEAGDRAFRLRAHVAPPESCAAAEIIVGELLGNVVRHAPGPFEILLEWETDAGVLRVIDTGPVYRPSDIDLPEAMAESSPGLFIVLACGARDLRTYRAEDGRHVTQVRLPTQKSTAPSQATCARYVRYDAESARPS